MSILSGFFKTKKYRKTPNGYKLQSLWTSSETVEMGDGNTVETNLGAIQGITSSLATENDNYALSATAGKNLQDQITTVNTDLGKLFAVYLLSSNTLSGNCNNLPLNSIGYTYESTVNSPANNSIIFTYGISDKYKVQIAVSSLTGALKSRSYNNVTWTDWV